MARKPNYSIKAVSKDESGIVAGSGFVIVDRHGARVDWPMLTTIEEANTDLADLRRSDRELAEDETSERFGLRMMGDLSTEAFSNEIL